MDHANIIIPDICLVLAYTAFNSLFDTWKISQQWNIDHRIEGGIQLVVLLGIAAIWPAPWLYRALMAAMNLTLFWLTFDYLLNTLRAVLNEEKWIDWWHLGDAKMDLILKGFENRWKRLILKFTLFVATLTLNLAL